MNHLLYCPIFLSIAVPIDIAPKFYFSRMSDSTFRKNKSLSCVVCYKHEFLRILDILYNSCVSLTEPNNLR